MFQNNFINLIEELWHSRISFNKMNEISEFDEQEIAFKILYLKEIFGKGICYNKFSLRKYYSLVTLL